MSDSEIGMDVLLSRIAGELAGLRELALHAEAYVGELVLGDRPSCSRRSASIQELDRLTQTLGCLSSVLVNLSQRCPADLKLAKEQVSDSMRLVSLTQRLLHEIGPPVDEPPEIEFF